MNIPKISKRILSLLLALLLAISMLPIQALADVEEPADIPSAGEEIPSEAAAVTGIVLGQDSLTVPLGGYSTLTYTITPEDAANQEILWSSSDETVATVSDGQVAGISEGTAIITAATMNGECSASVTATVAAVPNPFSRSGDAAETAVSATVSMTVQADNAYLCAPQFAITVAGDLAERYGYTDGIPAHLGVTTLDVLVKAHEIVYGEDFNQETASTMLEVGSSGWASNVFGLGGNFSFAINGEYACDLESEYGEYGYTGYTVNQAPVVSGDWVEFFHYQDSSYFMDYYTWFEQEGSRVSSVTANEGESFALNLQGYIYAYGSAYVGQDRVDNGMLGAIADAQITTVDIATGVIADIPNTVTDTDGNVSLTFEEAGTYYISAYTHYEDTYQYILLPLLKVTVDEAVEESPKLTGLSLYNASFTEPAAFAADTLQYTITPTRTNGDFDVTPGYDNSCQTLNYSYNNGAASGTLSGSYFSITDVPYGATTLTLTLTDNASGQATIYTLTVRRSRVADDTLLEGYGGIYLSSHGSQKLRTADEDGTPTSDTAANISNAHKYYYAKLAKDTAQTFTLDAEPSSMTAHMRYSTDDGSSWTTMTAGMYSMSTEDIAAPAKVIIQILSDAAYYESAEGWEGKSPNQFTVWIEGEGQSGSEGPEFSGTGTQADPYLLSTPADLERLDTLVEDGETFSGKYFKITSDITLSSGWDGIGHSKIEIKNVWGSMVPSTTEFKPFAGILDGGGCTLTFPSGSQPLFDCVRTAVIRNLKIKGDIADDGLIANYAEDGNNVTADISSVTILSGTKITGSGLLGGYASGSNKVTIDNCHIQSGVTVGTAAASNIGGIAGDFNGTITNSTCAATIYGKDFVGGIVGGQGQSMSETAITGCTFSGTVVATGNYAGGISGCGYTGTGYGFSNNAGCITIRNCIVTDAASITGGNYVGGILGAEPAVMQCWENGTGEITSNSFTGRVSASGSYIGGIVGYMKSLNKYNVISGNTYKNAQAGIGGITYVDTNCANPTEVEGTTYVNSESAKTGITGMSKTGHNRTDDPLGADAENLARCLDTEKPEEPTKPTVTKLTVSESGYKIQYKQGENLDLTGAVFTAAWSDGNTTNPKLSEVTVSGYDPQKSGTQTLTVTYEGAKCYITVNVIATPTNTTITVTFTMLGDSAHGDDGSVHTLRNGGLTTWISATQYTMSTGSTVLDLLAKACGNNGVSYSYAGNYVNSVTRGGVTLAGFTNGPRSGWMYTINGSHSDYGVSEQKLSNGDAVVFHYTDDYDVEYRSTASSGTGTVTRKTEAQKVIDLINKIGTVSNTTECRKRIEAARAAYDKLTAAQKKQVTNYVILEAAEKTLAALMDTGTYEDVYKATGTLLAKQEFAIGSDWIVLGLIRSGYEVGEDYGKELLQYIRENTDENMRLHRTKSSDNSRTILVLTALGQDATDVEGVNLVAGLDSMDYICKQGINGAFWALLALDCGNYPVPGGDVTREKLVQTILDAQLSDGGWALSGETSDPDMTGMALQALAPYHDAETASDVSKAVDAALAYLSRIQNSDGSFSTGSAPTAESSAQVIVALTALGIDPDTDERFIKNGISALDGLLSFYVPGEGFRHTMDGGVNGMATEQAYCALTAYNLFLNAGNHLYDMTDILDMGGDAPAEETEEKAVMAVPKEEPVPEKPGFFQWLMSWIFSWFAGK